MLPFKYRSDIDGLRAVAVLLVLFLHTDCGFAGGYIGVDMFFVISGFLITGLIIKNQQKKQFRLAMFWSRRIKRIVPAAFVVVVVTLLAGAWILLPEDYEQLAASFDILASLLQPSGSFKSSRPCNSIVYLQSLGHQ